MTVIDILYFRSPTMKQIPSSKAHDTGLLKYDFKTHQKSYFCSIGLRQSCYAKF